MASPPNWLKSALRHDTVYRTLGPPAHAQRWVCGFIFKPNYRGDYVDRVTSDFVIVYVLRGSGRFVDAQGRSHPVVAGDLLHHVPGRRHSLLPDHDGQWAEVYIAAPGSFEAVLHATGHAMSQHSVSRCGLHPELVERFEQVLAALRSADDVMLERLPAWLLELVIMAGGLEHRSGTDPRVQLVHEACRLLGGDLDKRTSLPRIAEELGVGYESFRKMFAQQMGLSPREYRIRRRIDRARELIQQDGLSNKAAAYSLGYADPFVFSKQFKAVVGISPAEFRRRMR